MTKKELQQAIIEALESDFSLFSIAARAAHAAATHAECQPDNKYDTTALEASYIAQGQANRAQEIRAALDCYRSLEVQAFDDEMPIRLGALITLEDEEGGQRRFFLGPLAGGLKVSAEGVEIVVITPLSPLGKNLLGRLAGDEIRAGAADIGKTLTIIDVC